MTAPETKSMQLWPSSRSVSLRYVEGKLVGIREERKARWRKPTDEERRAVRVEELAEQYRDREIYCCDSSLVSDLIREDNDEFSCENVVNLQADPSNWTLEQCKEWLEDKGEDLPEPNPWGMGRAALVESLESASIECRDEETDDILRAAVVANVEDETIDGLDAWRDAVRDVATEHEKEIYEWWRVSEWFAKQMIAIGECVMDNAYGYWWGRCCTGQSMMMDGTLQRVAGRMVDQYGLN